MPLSLSQLHQRLAKGPLPPIVLLASAEPLLLMEAADAVRAQAREQGYGERLVFEVESGFNWNELGGELSNRSLFSSRRLFEVRLPTGRPGRDGSAALIEYMKERPPDIVMLVQAAQWSRAHETAWVKQADQVGWLVPIWPKKPHELPEWISQRLASRGLRADPEAGAILAERVEGNLLAAAQEVDKLALLYPGTTLDAATMQALVADSARFDVFGLTEAALFGDAQRALRILAGLRSEGQQVPALLPWVASQVTVLVNLATTRAHGGNLAAAMKKAGLWQSRQAAFNRALSRGQLPDFEALLAACARLDRIAKGRADGDAWREMERLIAAIAAPRLVRV